MAKTIGIFTSIRSEYGPLKPLIRALAADNHFHVQLLVGGAHLLDSFGRTITEIEQDGLRIHSLFPFIREKNGVVEPIWNSLGRLQTMIGQYLEQDRPDLLLVLGDRFELLPVATAALLSNTPLAHISGGETTEGAIDNQVRHALTKLAHLHFPACAAYGHNILQMGEEPWRICISGEPSLDDVSTMSYIPAADLFESIGIPEQSKVIIMTFHPETIANDISPEFIESVIRGILTVGEFVVVATAANFDEGGVEINHRLEEMSVLFAARLRFIKSLGKLKYYSLMRHAKLIIGNSSSGLIEAQSFGLPVLNVGKRQAGRLANPNVLHCSADTESVLSSMAAALHGDFRANFDAMPNIYGDGRAVERIVSCLRNIDFGRLFLKRDVFSVGR